MAAKKSSAKRNLILSGARNVFIRKGYALVTMKDIIEECNISRGGIYLYFASVNQIFIEVIEAHNRKKSAEARKYISDDKTFEQVVDEYLTRQKARLSNLHNSFLIAMYEYRFASDNHRDFFRSQFEHTKNSILEILHFGCRKSGTAGHDIDTLAASVVLLIEGISMLAIAVGVDGEFVDKQFAAIKHMMLCGCQDGEQAA